MQLKRILPKFMLLVFLLPLNIWAKEEADDILGFWLSEEKTGIVQVVKEQGEYKGYLVWVKRIATGEKEDVLDDKNPDEKLQKRSVWGMNLFWGFKFDDDEWNGGHIYDPKSGKTYKCKLSLEEDKKTLNIRGYVGIPLFGRTSHWTKVEDISSYKKVKAKK